jgi:hypothetical protein
MPGVHGAASTGVRTLDWAELVPPGWEAPIIAPAYDQDTDQLVEEGSRVSALDGLVVKLPGYMKPVVFEGRSVTEFLLVPFLPHHIKQHAHLESNQRVYVSLEQAIEVENPFEPVWVTGTLQLEAVATDEGPAGYSIIGASASAYQAQ